MELSTSRRNLMRLLVALHANSFNFWCDISPRVMVWVCSLSRLDFYLARCMDSSFSWKVLFKNKTGRVGVNCRNSKMILPNISKLLFQFGRYLRCPVLSQILVLIKLNVKYLHSKNCVRDGEKGCRALISGVKSWYNNFTNLNECCIVTEIWQYAILPIFYD